MNKGAEKRRLLKMTSFEREALASGYGIIAGIDEAGRGPLAGPVVAAAAIVEPGHLIHYVDDSKKLSPALRKTLFTEISSDPKVHYAIGIVEHDEIDRINIYHATVLAMKKAIAGLKKLPELLLIDGMKLKDVEIPQWRIVQGDSLSHTIAIASIIAKVTRDAIMELLHLEFPGYGFDKNKGYATEEHLNALDKLGPCCQHRRSFSPIKEITPSLIEENVPIFIEA